MLKAILMSLVFSFFVAGVTGAILPIKKIRSFPAGSILSGLMTGYSMTQNVLISIVCGFVGFLGWVLFLYIIKKISLED